MGWMGRAEGFRVIFLALLGSSPFSGDLERRRGEERESVWKNENRNLDLTVRS